MVPPTAHRRHSVKSFRRTPWALNPTLRTVRAWEGNSWLPESPLYRSGVIDMTDLSRGGTEDVRGRRYLYTLEMLEDARQT